MLVNLHPPEQEKLNLHETNKETWPLDFAGLSQHDVTNLLSSASSTGETLLPLMQTASFLLRHVNDGGNLVTANGIEVVEMADGV